jgi:hypothetical protein
MNDRDMRLECLKLASIFIPGRPANPDPENVMKMAQRMFDFVWGNGLPSGINEPARREAPTTNMIGAQGGNRIDNPN